MEVENEVQEPVQDQTYQVEESTTEPVQEDKEVNIRQIRLSKEAAEKERDEAYRKLREYQALAENERKYEPEPITKSESIDEDFNLLDDDLVEGKHLGKVAQKIKKLEKELESYKKQSTAVTVESQLKSKYTDFDKVVSRENIDALTKEYPELAHTVSSCSDLYSQAVTAYTMIKRMGIYVEDKFEGDRKTVEENSSKPRPLASVSPQQGNSPLSRANAFAGGLTDELKKQLVKEMEEARSRL